MVLFWESIKNTDWLFSYVPFVLFFLLCLREQCWILRKRKKRQGLFGYKLIYADQKATRKQKDFGKLLYSKKYDIQGKPDYIFQKRFGNAIVPVELKSGSIRDDNFPHPGDRLQLATYFLLIEDVYGVRPKYGRLVYKDYMFDIRNTIKIRREVRRTLANMRQMLQTGQGKANCSVAGCRYCICKGTVCPYWEVPKQRKVKKA